MKIARRFNAGFTRQTQRVPKGRPNGRGMAHPGMEFRLQAAGRGQTHRLAELLARPSIPLPHRLKAELHTRMGMPRHGQTKV